MEKLTDRIKVSNYTTRTPSLPNYKKATYEERLHRMQEVIFLLKTWAVPTGEISNRGFCSISEKEQAVDGTSLTSVSE